MDNRLLYNGKEEQVTGDLDYLDYGWRMYDSGLGRWFGMDLLAEDYLNQSPYHFCGNNPMIFVDQNGMDYWTTSDRRMIERFFNMLRGTNCNPVESFDYSDWAHYTDAEVTSLLTLDDKNKKLWSSYGAVIDGVGSRVGVSLDVTMLLGMAAFVPSRQSVLDRIDRNDWYRRSSGAVRQDYTLETFLLPIGKGLGMLSSWAGKLVGIGTKGGIKTLQQFNSVESIVQNAGKLTKLKGGVRQGFVKGNADDIFNGLAEQYGAKIQTNGTEMFFQSGNIRVGLHPSVRGAGIPTLHISNANKLYKIRITP